MKKNNSKYKIILEKAQSKYATRRWIGNLITTSLFSIAGIVAILFTCLILFLIFYEGLKDFHISMITKTYNQNELNTLGYTGIAGPIITTIILIFLVIIISTVISLFTAIFLHEYLKSKKLRSFILYFCSICNGIPSIIFGLFGFLIFVYVIHFSNAKFGILSSALTLSLVILPTMILGSYESLKNINRIERLASYSLGATKFQTTIKIVLPAAIFGIISTLLICTTRAIGEAAPVLFTIGQNNNIPHSALSNGNTLTVMLFMQFNSSSSYSFLFSIALIIIIMVFIINIIFRLINFIFGKNHSHRLSFYKKITNTFSNKYILKYWRNKLLIWYYSLINSFSG